MKLNRNGWLVRWAYFGMYQPTQTTLCKFFWLAFILKPLFWGAIAAFVGFLGYASWMSKGMFDLYLALFAGLVFIFASLQAYLEDTQKPFPTITNSVFWQGLKSVKSKFCPIIEIVDEPSLKNPLGTLSFSEYYNNREG